jgi:hypothetical protein
MDQPSQQEASRNGPESNDKEKETGHSTFS